MRLILWITFAFCRPCLAIQLSKTQLSDSTRRYGEEPRPLRCYSREAMLQLQCDQPHTNTPSHLCSSILDDIPRELLRNTRKKRRGRRGGVQNRLRRRFSRPPLPSIILTNLRSLSNQVDTLKTYTRYRHEYRQAYLLCFTESWRQSTMPESLFEVPGFTLVRADSDANSGKTRGGVICVYINDLWCRSYSVNVKPAIPT